MTQACAPNPSQEPLQDPCSAGAFVSQKGPESRPVLHFKQALSCVVHRQHAPIFDTNAHEAGRLRLEQPPKVCGFLSFLVPSPTDVHHPYACAVVPELVQSCDSVLGSLKYWSTTVSWSRPLTSANPPFAEPPTVNIRMFPFLDRTKP